MNNKRSWSRRNRQGRISRFAGMLGVFLLGCAPAAFAGVPDWLRAAAQQPLPEYPKDTAAIVLLSEQITTVKNNGEIETLHRQAWKILRPEGRKYGKVRVYFDNETRLTYLKAWCIPANGKDYEVKEKDAAETSLHQEEFFSDKRAKILQIPAADPGNVVGYEYVQKGRPFILQDQWWFQEDVPIHRARFTLRLPSGWEYDSHWTHYPAKPPQAAESSQFVWEIENIPPVIIEPDMPPFRAVAGRLAVNFYPRDAGPEARPQGSWHNVGAWYAGLVASSRQATPEIKQKVAEVTAKASTPLDKMKALAAFLQRDIRYVAIEIGIGGYQPHPAGNVFANRYGDCKDKVTLLSSMLQEIGVESYYVLIHTDRGVVLPDFPMARTFNHMIMAIRLPASVDANSLYAVMNHPKLGKLLFFDPTDPYTPFGYLPATLQDNNGLLVGPDGGESVELPLLAPTCNRLMRTAQFSLSPNGTLSGKVEEVRWGGPATYERAQFLTATGTDRRKIIEDFLNNFLPGFTLTGATVGNLDRFDDSLVLNYSFVVDRYAKTAGDLLVVRPRVLGEKTSDLLEIKERHYPIEFPEATLQTDTFEITLPPGYVVDDIPSPVHVGNGFAEYSSKVEVNGNLLRYSRSYEIKKVIVPTQNLDELKTFFRQIAADERASAVLRRANP